VLDDIVTRSLARVASIYDSYEILLQCSKCGLPVAKRVLELRTRMPISCPDCGTAIPVGNLTELVLEAINRRLASEKAAPDSSDSN
jgi:DNA-directed RNA polymerase subunit RPC12/RpoP